MGTRNKTKMKNQAMDRQILSIETLESRTLLSGVSGIAYPELTIHADASPGSIQGYTPSQIASAYGFNQITLTGGIVGDGAGQTIGIVDAYNDPGIASDLSTFDSAFNLSAPPSFKVENQTGGTTNLPQTDAGWSEEISLDVEWAHTVAPQASILLVEANSADFNDLLTAVNQASHSLGVTVVSMSWGGSEFWGETQYDSNFTTPAGHKGVTYIAASGDQGPWNGPDWPAVSPNVISVGGTSLNLNSSGSYSNESAWSGSTGGVSNYEGEPGYQVAAQQTAARTAPDVSYDADPNTGFAVYDSLPYQGYSGWQEIGGTSAGAPQWAGLVAIANQGRKAAGEAVMNSTRATLASLYNTYNSSAQYGSTFHDVTSDGAGQFYYTASTGYDGVTGLGTPKAAAVVNTLVTGADPVPLTTSARRAPNGNAAPIDVRKAPAPVAFAPDMNVTSRVQPVVLYAPASPVQVQVISLPSAASSVHTVTTISTVQHSPAIVHFSNQPIENVDFSTSAQGPAQVSPKLHKLQPATVARAHANANSPDAASFWSMTLENSDVPTGTMASHVWDALAALIGVGFIARGLSRKSRKGAPACGFEPRID